MTATADDRPFSIVARLHAFVSARAEEFSMIWNANALTIITDPKIFQDHGSAHFLNTRAMTK
jgi:hypothetical protein